MSSPTPDPFGLVGTRLDGKYEVESVIAEGGFGVVYRATHRTLGTPVAVKVLKVPEQLGGAARKAFLDRFAQEAQVIARLDHPAIVRVTDFGASLMPMSEAAPWMVLEWLTGSTLDADLEARRNRGGRAPSECLAILKPAFDALSYAHDDGIAHRDIKPENLFLAETRRGGRTLRVLDFGIAKAMGDEEGASSGQTATRTQQRAFSLYYAAPEQLSGTRTGPWTDVYALALVLTEMLTDWPPYDGADVQDIYADVLSPRRPTPAKRGFDVGAWEPVIARAVASKPAERFQNAREFLAALEASVPSVVRAPSLAPQTPPSQTPDTLTDSNIAQDTTPMVKRRGRATLVGIVAVATLGLVVGVGSYLAASRNPAPIATDARAAVARPEREPVVPTTVVNPTNVAEVLGVAPVATQQVADAGVPTATTRTTTRLAAPATRRVVPREQPPPPRTDTPTPRTTPRARTTGFEAVPTE